MELKICLALTHPSSLLSCTYILHSFLFSNASFGMLLQPFVSRHTVSFWYDNQNGKGSPSHCFLLTHFASAQQPMAAWLATVHHCTFLHIGEPHHLPVSWPALGFRVPAKAPGAELQQNVLKHWRMVQVAAPVLSFVFTMAFEKQ